jgi:putative acid phosphatase of HAD superfamily subfamily IIIB
MNDQPWLAAFGTRAVRPEQTRILRSAIAAIRPDRPAAAFDLDSTLLSNKARQARIVREFGQANGDRRLAACSPEAVVSWDLRDSARLCGLSDDEAKAVYPRLKQFWQTRFFTSEYCKDDEPVPGAREFLEQVRRAGGEILYITGRHEEMGEGTLESFRRAGFPLPDGEDVQLWLKPKLSDDDDRWKEICHQRLLALRGIACAFDNEPTHVNAYKRSFPDAVIVHLDTDHSRRPVPVLADVPSITDFRMEPAA